MGAIVKTGMDRFVLAGTIVSGIIFIGCIGLMLSDYKPLRGKDIAYRSYNKELYAGMVQGYNVVKTKMSDLPHTITSSITKSVTVHAAPGIKGGIEEVTTFGRTLLWFE